MDFEDDIVRKIKAKQKSTKPKITGQKKRIDRRFRTHYIRYTKLKKVKQSDILSKDEANYCRAQILKEIKESILENSGGVLIKNFGYFFIFKSPGKVLNRKFKYGAYKFFKQKRHKTGYIAWTPVFIPHKKEPDLKFWRMDYSFSKTLYKNIQTRVLKGELYKNYIFTLRPMLGLSQTSFRGKSNGTNKM